MLRRRWQSLVRPTERCERVFQASSEPFPRVSFLRKIKTVFLLSAFVALAQFFPALVATVNADVTYVYDSIGQLIAVVDGSGNAATYTYDPVGNLTAITPASSSGVLIFEIDPGSGPIGMQLTIFGDRFSTTPSQNSVQFAGASPVVPSASTQTTLRVTVPANATTGAVSVTSPAGFATGPIFTVTQN
jgi:YD repeat-containing protein